MLQNWIWIAVVVLAVLLILAAVSAAGRRRSMAGGETVVSGGSTGAGFVLGIVFIIAVLVILAFVAWQGNWFGVQTFGPAQTMTSPAVSPSMMVSPPASASP